MPVALVTGASRGIGRATARALIDAGWQVALAARDVAALEETAEGWDSALILPLDVSDAEAVEAAVAQVASSWGRLDLLFNNAGTGVPAAPIDEIAVADWLALERVNITGMFLCARAAFAQMRRQSPQGGRIINNGSIAAHAPRPGSAPYTMSKHAVTGLTKSLSLDGRPFDIACGQIDIGNADTDMIRAMKASGSAGAEPAMDVDHVARSVLHMAGLPLDANVQFMTVLATKMPYIGRG